MLSARIWLFFSVQFPKNSDRYEQHENWSIRTSFEVKVKTIHDISRKPFIIFCTHHGYSNLYIIFCTHHGYSNLYITTRTGVLLQWFRRSVSSRHIFVYHSMNYDLGSALSVCICCKLNAFTTWVTIVLTLSLREVIFRSNLVGCFCDPHVVSSLIGLHFFSCVLNETNLQ